MYQTLHQLDIAIFKLINHLPHDPVLDLFAIFIHLLTLTGFIFFVLSIYWWFILPKKEKYLPILAILLWFVTFCVNFFIFKPIFHRIRPPLKIEHTITIGVIPDSNAFPSGQAATTLAYAIPFLIFSQNKKVKWGLTALALLTGLDRAYMGHHYPFDVIAGYISGILISCIGSFVWYKYLRYKFGNKPKFKFW